MEKDLNMAKNKIYNCIGLRLDSRSYDFISFLGTA